MQRFALDETGREISIDNVPDDLRERHLHTYTCPGCKNTLIARKGMLRIHHFAHEKGAECDPWAQSEMSDWHRLGQDKMAQLGGKLEVWLRGPSFNHRADVVFEETSTIVELQHSPISIGTFIERSNLYTERFDNLVWLFDARKFAERLSVSTDDRMVHGDSPGCWQSLANRRDTHSVYFSNPRSWFTEVENDVRAWHARGLSLALYVEGEDDFSDGYVMELFPRAGSYGTTAHVWHLGDWLDALTKRRLPFMRMSSAQYKFADGHTVELSARYGLTAPLPDSMPELPKDRKRVWELDGKQVNPSSIPLLRNDTLMFTEKIFFKRANVSVWLERKSRGRRSPDCHLFILASTPMEDVIRQVRSEIGEWRANDYDWGMFPNRACLDEDIKLTLPVLDGRHKYPLKLYENTYPYRMISEMTWHYETETVGQALDKAKESMDAETLSRYNWDDVNRSLLMSKPREIMVPPADQYRMVEVVVQASDCTSLMSCDVCAKTSWEEIREMALEAVEDASQYDWSHLPDRPISDSCSVCYWVVEGRPCQVSVVFEGDELARFEIPYGASEEKLRVALRKRIRPLPMKYTFSYDAGKVTGDIVVPLGKNLEAEHSILVRDMMGGRQPQHVHLPYWIDDTLPKINLLPPSGEFKFAGLYIAKPDGTHEQAIATDGRPRCNLQDLAQAKFLDYGYICDGELIFSQSDYDKLCGISHDDVQAQLF